MPLSGKTIEHPRFHAGPSQDSATIEVLDPGVPLQLVGLENDYFRVFLDDGREGFVHRDLVAVDGQRPPTPAPPDAAPPAIAEAPAAPTAVMMGRTTGHPRFHTDSSENSPTIEVLSPGVPLRLVGLENDYWRVVLTDGRPGFVHSDLVVVGTGVATVSIGNPFNEKVFVTASSLERHHTVYEGDASCDLDTGGPSRGTPVQFRASCSDGSRIRGRVVHIGFACATHILQDGGNWVRLALEKQENGVWISTGQHVNYAHLDPLSVSVDDVVEDGVELGKLGPANPAGFPAGVVLNCRTAHAANDPMLDEYHSGCAVHSHTHLEATGNPWVHHAGADCAAEEEVMRINL